MDPIEQIGKEIRKLGFQNEMFSSLDNVLDCLCLTISSPLPELISRITAISWILNVFGGDQYKILNFWLAIFTSFAHGASRYGN